MDVITGFKTVTGEVQKIDPNVIALGSPIPNDGDVLSYKDETIKWTTPIVLSAGTIELEYNDDLPTNTIRFNFEKDYFPIGLTTKGTWTKTNLTDLPEYSAYDSI